MDRIAASRCQQPHGLGNDRAFSFLALHGEHRLAHDYVGTARVQAGFRSVRVHNCPTRANQLGNLLCSDRVFFDPRVRGRSRSENFRCGASKSGRKLNDTRTGQACIGQHLEGQFQPSGTQNAFADAREYPVSGSVRGRTLRNWKGIVSHGFSSHSKSFWPT